MTKVTFNVQKARLSLINQLIKTVEKYMNTTNFTTVYDDCESELFAEDASFLEDYVNVEENMNLLNNYDENAIAYFAGFVARRSIGKSNCENCRDDMMKTPMDDATANEKYIEFREYANENDDAPTVTKLVRPTIVFINIIKTQLMTFNRTWQYHWASTHILKNIVTECVNATNRTHAEWLDMNHKCYNHRMQALQYMITVKLYSRTRYNNRAEKRSNTSHRKMKNILNK